MIGRVERYGQLGDNMHAGSRKHRSTIEKLFKKVITYDVLRQQRSNLAVFDNDAASCYDCILVNLAMVCARRLGAPPQRRYDWHIQRPCKKCNTWSRQCMESRRAPTQGLKIDHWQTLDRAVGRHPWFCFHCVLLSSCSA